MLNNFNLGKTDLIETLIFSVGPFVALVAARLGFRTWQRFEFLVAVAVAIAALAQPKQVFGILTVKPLDNYSLFLAVLTSVYYIHAHLFPFLVGSSDDKSIYNNHLWGKIVMSTLIFADNLLVYSRGSTFNYKLMCLSGGFHLVRLLISVYFYIRAEKPVRKNQFPDTVNHVAKIESFILLVTGLACFGYPDVTFPSSVKSNEIHMSLIRISGIICISASFESYSVAEFLHIGDKKKFMLARLIGCFLEIGAFLLGLYHFKALNTTTFSTLLAANMFYTSFILYGFLVTGSTNTSSSNLNKSVSSAKSPQAASKDTARKAE